MTRPFDITSPPPPHGTLVEASAGTGKTHAVAASVAKALATNDDLRIGEIVVTTFTRNAAAELRERIRGRLVATAKLLRGQPAPAGYRPDELDDHLLAHPEPPGSTPADMARRLERALAEFDTALIGTIHTVCARILRIAGVQATDTGDEELEGRVLDEVVNDAVVTEALAGRQWDERQLRTLVKLKWSDPFLETWFDPAGCLAAERPLLDRVPDLIDACVGRARERMRATPGFDELLVRAWEEVTIRATDSPAERQRKESFLGQVRERFKLAIVDEAQDTNRLQWEFFHALFPPTAERPLFAVGDPKQAIYGFRGGDVTAYIHHAQRDVPLEDGEPPRRTLSVNRRSDGPLLAGLNALMGGVEFGAGIPYREVEPAPERAISRLVGLRPVELLDLGGVGIVEAAVRKVHEALTQRHLDESAAADGGGQRRPFRPKEVAVLVRVNQIGTAIARRLRLKNIPAVTEGTASVMTGEMATDLGWLLEAMARPSDQGRARRAAATVFFGEDLASVAGLGEAREEKIQSAIQALHAVLARQGIAAFAARVMADTAMATRIAGGPGGDRRLVDFGHVVELLNDASRGRGCHARVMLEHLASLVAQDEKAELVSRRVESDEEAVTIMTVHKAKGLQYPCVIVADAWSPEISARQPVVFHANGTRVVDIGTTIANGTIGDDSKRAAIAAANDERRRLMYVAVTRPQHHVSILRPAEWRESLLGNVLAHAPDTAATILPALADAIAVRSAAELDPAEPWPQPPPSTSIDVARSTRSIEQTYLRTSYTGIAKQAARVAARADDPEGPGRDEERLVSTPAAAGGDADEPDDSGSLLVLDDEPATTTSTAEIGGFSMASLPAGTAFGTVVHAIFERVSAGPEIPEAVLRDEIRRVVDNVATARFLLDHRTGLTAMIADAMLTPFGGPAAAAFRDLRFADFGPADRLAELNFEMALAALDKRVKARHVGRVLATALDADHPLAAYAERLAGRAFDVPLAGLINGSIDAVLRIPGRPADDPRLVIADYKTNRLHAADATAPLAAYAPCRLADAMGEHHYPLQALVYGTAVWRMLRWRLGSRKPPGWDPGECLAGIVYGFVRGMRGPATPVDAAGGRYGVFTWQPPVAIWRQLSDLFAGDLPGEHA